MNPEIYKLNLLGRQFRQDVIETLYKVQTGHPGGSLSVTEILIAVYYLHARVRPTEPDWPARDRIVLCKGHAAPMLYRVLAEKGFFDLSECKDLRQCGGNLPGHPSTTTPGIDLASGPLGIGYSAAVGMALAQKLDCLDALTFAILGDGDLDEGTFWEGLMSAVKFKVDNLIAILDNNGVQLDGTCEEIMPAGDLSRKFQAFGAHTIEVNGHDIEELSLAIELAKRHEGAPSIIIAKTIKGKGVSFMEGKNSWHGKAIGESEYYAAMAELKGAD